MLTLHTLSVSIQLVHVLFASPGPLTCVQGRKEMILLGSSLLDLTRIDILLNEEEEAGDGSLGIRNARLFREDLFWFSLWLHLLSPPSPHPTLLPPNTHTHGNLPLPAATFRGRGCHVKSWERELPHGAL